jgi:hemoglobin
MTMTTHSDSRAPAGAEATSIYEAIGGRAALAAAVDHFYGRLLADPMLSPFFPGGVGARHRAYLITVLGEALGGPERYRGPDLAGAHRGLGISDAHFDRTAAHLDATLDELGVPRHLTDRIIGIVAGLRPAVVTVLGAAAPDSRC